MAENFIPGDLRLGDYQLDQIVRCVLPRAIEEGLLSTEDVKFLRLWQSGDFFQTAQVPVLFPYDEDVSDISKTTRLYRGFHYYDDIVVRYEGVKYRLLELRGEQALPILLNWLRERGITEDELKLQFAIFVRENGKPSTGHPLNLGTKRLIANKDKRPKPPRKTFSKTAAARKMSEVKRLPNGSVSASSVKKAFNEQLRLHNYTIKAFAAGTGLPLPLVKKWSKGEITIKPDEMKKICAHLGVKSLFQGTTMR